MPPDANMPYADAAPRRGTVESFRQLTARLKRAPPQPVSADAAPPPPQSPLPSPPIALAEELPLPAPAPQRISPPSPTPGEAAAALIDMIWGALDLTPQERSIAGDTLLLLLPVLSPHDLVMLAERIAAMESPPPLLVSQLLRDPRPEVGGVVLERSANLDPDELLAACRDAAPERLRLLARRRSVPRALSARLVESGDLIGLLTMLRNPAAELSFASFLRLSKMAAEHPGLQAPLALRSDLPLAVALDLLWCLPSELRRVVMARFLSDSVTLSRILAIALAAGETPLQVDEVPPLERVDHALSPLFNGRRDLAEERLAALLSLDRRTVERVFADEQADAVVVLLKALGLPRSRSDAVLDRMRAATGLIPEDRPQEELKAVFDALSFTKARVLLLYWDWFTRQAGPYATA